MIFAGRIMDRAYTGRSINPADADFRVHRVAGLEPVHQAQLLYNPPKPVHCHILQCILNFAGNFVGSASPIKREGCA
jgi:hypothetical protein